MTLDLNSVPLREAVKQFLAATDLSVVIVGDLPMEPRITMRLKDANPIDALCMLATLGNLEFNTSYQAGGQSGPNGPPPVAALAARPRRPLDRSLDHAAPPGQPNAPGLPALSLPPGVSDLPVSLNVKDERFDEAINILNNQIEPALLTRLTRNPPTPSTSPR